MYPKKTIERDGFIYSSDINRLDLDFLHAFLTERSYWAQGISKALVAKAIQNSFCFGVYEADRQVGFARLVTDYATFAYLADVCIDEAFRGRSLSKKLMDFIFSFDEVKAFRRMILVTRDAHTLYTRYGFTSLATPEKYMELHRPDMYKTQG